MRRLAPCIALSIAALLASGTNARPQVGSDPDPAPLGDRGLVAHRQALLDLTNPFTVMCVACHPDDEDGLTLTVERRKYGARTVTLFATSGEGGQNAVGPELYDELGRIRERETVEASEIQGSHPYFLRLRDFGFSKTGDEAMRVWEQQMGGHEKLLELWVRALRQIRPDAIITNHDTKTGHGQHQATGRLIIEAVTAAADSARFPAAGDPWKVQSLSVRTPLDSPTGTLLPADGFDSASGLTYREIAFRALLRHATQGPWSFKNAPNATRYTPVVAPAGRPSGSIGSPLTAPLEIGADAFVVERSQIDGDPGRLLAALIARSAGGISATNRRRVDSAIAGLLGVDFRMTQPNSPTPVGSRVETRLVIANGSTGALTIQKLSFSRQLVMREMEEPAVAWQDTPIKAGETRVFPVLLNVVGTSNGGDATFPGDEQPPIDGVRAVPNGAVGEYGVKLDCAVDSTHFSLQQTVRLDVVSPLELSTAVLPSGVVVRVRNTSSREVKLCGIDAAGTVVSGDSTIEAGGEYDFNLVHSFTGTISVTGCMEFEEFRGDRVRSTIGVRQLLDRIRVAPGLRVGFVRSYDYTLPQALDQLGVTSRELTPVDIRDGDLSRFNTIVIDNRAYLKYPELVRANSRLLDYVQRGGTLIVFYHKREEYAPELAPYPIKLGSSRVTDELAPVRILSPRHPIFRWPNAIGPKDFEGWVQERGLYFPVEWDKRYTPLLSTNDPGEKPLDGGLLVAKVGQGTFVYTSYVWYRQLRALVPGGYRVFANMISLGSQGAHR